MFTLNVCVQRDVSFLFGLFDPTHPAIILDTIYVIRTVPKVLVKSNVEFLTTRIWTVAVKPRLHVPLIEHSQFFSSTPFIVEEPVGSQSEITTRQSVDWTVEEPV